MRDYRQNNKDEYLYQRKRMVETQIIARGIKDQRVIQAFLKVPRHFFVENSLKLQAYDDNPLPIGFNQTISQPYMVAFMLEHLNLNETHKVLEIGTGSGYQTALLAELSKEVYTIERLPQLSQLAQERLKQLGYNSSGNEQFASPPDRPSVRAEVYYKIDDGTLGWHEFAPYDRIIISAAAPNVPQGIIKQLTDDGIMLCPVGSEYYQDLIQITKHGEKTDENNLGSCVFVKLVGKEGWKE
ncbi:MAG: protein-L-isoaspartate O-methyltransferase [Planctomycetota bacterium]